LFYSYEFVPQAEVWRTWLFTYRSGFYGDAHTGVWALMMKIVPLFLLLIWFFTCRHWWYHAIIVPIAMFSYQLFAALNEELIFFDKFQLIYLVPLMGVVIPSIYLIRAQMFNKINYADKTMAELEAEFMIKPTTLWGKIKQYF